MGGLREEVGPHTADPTALTTQQLLRENFWLRELLESRIAAVEVRIDGSDKAVMLLQAFADRTPTTKDVQHETEQLREVVMTMFSGIQTQLKDRDAQTDKATHDARMAVDAAFAAAKESMTKSEAGFTKQIDGIAELIRSSSRAVDDKINDMKERVTIIESKTSVSDPAVTANLLELRQLTAALKTGSDFGGGKTAGQAALWALIVGGVGLLFGLGSFIGLIMRILSR